MQFFLPVFLSTFCGIWVTVDSSIWTLILPSILVGVAASYLIEFLLQPRMLPAWKRVGAANFVHIAFWLLLYSVELAIFRRPWLASANAFALIYLMHLISNAKVHSLREPLIYQDIDYFRDVLRHPRLYLPFLGIGKSVMAAGAIGGVVFVGVLLEPPLTDIVSAEAIVLVLVVNTFTAALFLHRAARDRIPASLAPNEDLQKYGLVASLWLYAMEEKRATPPASRYSGNVSVTLPQSKLPTLVVVQSESFFDVRRICSYIHPMVMHEFDKMRVMSMFHGALEVPAWGANTVRTEFSFLSGLTQSELGVHQFNPYRRAARMGVSTIASLLKEVGYRTICVHPYAGTFYDRKRLYPLLGFDEFIDIRHFSQAQVSGPFVGDIPLAHKVGSLLGDSRSQPLFVFVISMENHGPLHLESVRPDEVENLYTAPPPSGCDDLTIYLRHLVNANKMLGMLRAQLDSLGTPSGLCWYGDHVPIMPDVYKCFGFPDGKTDYLVWKSNNQTGPARQLNIKSNELSQLLLQNFLK